MFGTLNSGAYMMKEMEETWKEPMEETWKEPMEGW